MQTQLPATLLSTEQGREADAILRRCVHCGFCNATCPTYQLTGDELDGPRGRIYLIKQLLEVDEDEAGEGKVATARAHLDRCLTCRNCETTCPSGVEYGRLLDMGREQVEVRGHRPFSERVMRWGLRNVLPFPRRFGLGLGVARLLRPLLPGVLRNAIPPRLKSMAPWPAMRHARRVILLDGCVQSVTAPEINRATARLLDGLGISVLRLSDEVCCGAVHQHLAAPEAAATMMRRNIDAWWPHLGTDADGDHDKNIEAIVSTASACGLQVKDYAHALRHDAEYAEKAATISALVKDISEIVAAEPVLKKRRPSQRVAFHSPCTLQHGQGLGGVVEGILRDWGHQLVPVKDSHLCCGSAGTYSILQAELSGALRANKLEALQANAPGVIASANVGCLLHLRQGAGQIIPVRHWVEVLADCLEAE
jgi:glycolate oxidase iron-sulfur subunit